MTNTNKKIAKVLILMLKETVKRDYFTGEYLDSQEILRGYQDGKVSEEEFNRYWDGVFTKYDLN